MPDAPATPEPGTPTEPVTPGTPAAPAAAPPATPEPATPTEPIRLPDDHPLVTAYAAVKGKLKEHDDAQLSEVERLTNSVGEQTARGDKAEARVALLEAAIEHGLTKDDLALLGEGSPEDIGARAKALAERLAGGESERKRRGNRVAGEGGNPTPAPDAERTAVRELFGKG